MRSPAEALLSSLASLCQGREKGHTFDLLGEHSSFRFAGREKSHIFDFLSGHSSFSWFVPKRG
jgi:hypothetical protein